MIEPITLVLVASVLALPVPTARPILRIKDTANFSAGYFAPQTNLMVVAKTESTMFSLPTYSENQVLDRTVLIREEILSYAQLNDGWDGEGSKAATPDSKNAAEQFLDLVPSGLELPRTMISSAGELGFYWDLPQGFADISFALDGSASFFSRSSDGSESYTEFDPGHVFPREWFFDSLKKLSPRIALAA
jgi:hypothetical protein